MSPASAARIIRIFSWIYLVAGLFTAAAAVPALAGPVSLFYDLVDWPLDGGAPALAQDSRLFAAIAGGVFAGFSALYIFLVAPLVERGDPLGRRGGLTGLLVWFVVDSTASVLAGVPGNAVSNAVLMAPILIPLFSLRRS